MKPDQKHSLEDSTVDELIDIVNSFCDDCEGTGIITTGGMAIEDDLAEDWPCDNEIHYKNNIDKLLAYTNTKIAKELESWLRMVEWPNTYQAMRKAFQSRIKALKEDL